MSFRKLARDAFDSARDRYRQYEESKERPQANNAGYQQPFPGQQYHNQGYPTQYPPQASQNAYAQGPSYPAQQAWIEPPPPVPPRPASMRPPIYPAYDSSQNVAPLQPSQQPAYPAPQMPFSPSSPPPASQPSTAPGIDIFVPMTTSTIPIPSCDEHPVPRRCIRAPGNATPPSQTNAFYGNWLLGEQGCSIWTHPYSLSWPKGNGNAKSWGIAVSHVDREQLAFGEPTSTGGSRYYINPNGIHSIILSAREVGPGSTLVLDSLQAFSANANLFSNSSSPVPALTFPLLQGMGFVTAICNGCSPLVQSSVFFRDIQPAGLFNSGLTSKYRLILEDGKAWLLYATALEASQQPLPFIRHDNTTIGGPPDFHGVLQIAKLPPQCSEEFYNRSAGAYAVSCTISARVYGNQGTYTMTWTKAGTPNPVLMYALQHHVRGFTRTTAPHVTPMRLQTTTKGVATAVLADNWQINEQIPEDMGFTPWIAGRRLPSQLSPVAATAVAEAGKAESDQDFIGQCNLDSMYFSGKGLGKFAMMAVALHMAGQRQLVDKVVQKLKQAVAIFVNNQQRTPLVYEKSWRGVVSRSGMENAGADFGNGYYNDHHFHYGYFVYAAAVIGHFDPSWLREGQNIAWVNTLVRDFANPVNDADFPFFRSFDWFHGHSWAKGLFESGDGKDEESTSEDSFASYALKMWGKTSGDANLEARGNLMLAIQAKVFQTYFLMEKSNTAQPPQIIPNKVTGITFENKVDHATYFGMNIEYIQGIHMIPLAPPSTLVRTSNFVREEWETYFSNGRADQAGGGWRGILYANLAIVDPKRAYGFFSQQNFDWGWLDGGASRTWLLAWCSALGGA